MPRLCWKLLNRGQPQVQGKHSPVILKTQQPCKKIVIKGQVTQERKKLSLFHQVALGRQDEFHIELRMSLLLSTHKIWIPLIFQVASHFCPAIYQAFIEDLLCARKGTALWKRKHNACSQRSHGLRGEPSWHRIIYITNWWRGDGGQWGGPEGRMTILPEGLGELPREGEWALPWEHPRCCASDHSILHVAWLSLWGKTVNQPG